MYASSRQIVSKLCFPETQHNVFEYHTKFEKIILWDRTSVNVVSQEQIVGLGREASILKQPEQVCVLAVDIT